MVRGGPKQNHTKKKKKKNLLMYRYCSLVRQAFQWFLNVQKQFGFAAQDSFTVQNHQQDWNDEFIEGTIMRITLPEN